MPALFFFYFSLNSCVRSYPAAWGRRTFTHVFGSRGRGKKVFLYTQTTAEEEGGGGGSMIFFIYSSDENSSLWRGGCSFAYRPLLLLSISLGKQSPSLRRPLAQHRREKSGFQLHRLIDRKKTPSEILPSDIQIYPLILPVISSNIRVTSRRLHLYSFPLRHVCF